MENRTNSNFYSKSNLKKPKVNTDELYKWFDSKRKTKEIMQEFNLSKSTISYHRSNWKEEKEDSKKIYRKQKALELVEKLESKDPDEIIKIFTDKEKQKLDELDIDTLLDMLEKRMAITAIKAAQYIEKHIDKEFLDTKEAVVYLRGYS